MPSSSFEHQRHEMLSMPSSSMHCEQVQAVPQQMIEQELHPKLIHVSDDRLSPNLFLNLNFDNSSAMDTNANSLKFEWSSFNPNIITTTAPSVMSPVSSHKQQTFHMSSSPTYEFLNVDNFFKNECILNLDHNLLSSVGDSSGLMTGSESRNIDLQNFSLSDDSKELLDLEKPINISVVSGLDGSGEKF